MSGFWTGVLLAGAAGMLAVSGLLEIAGGFVGKRKDASPSNGRGDVTLRSMLLGTIEPLGRARREGYLPTSDERFRIGLLFAVAAVLAGWWFVGTVAGVVMAVCGPLLAGWLIHRGLTRYRRSVERALPDVARAIADCLSAGHSPRGAMIAATSSLEGPVRSEFQALRYELEAGAPTADAIANLARRFGSPRVDAFATALGSQRLAGGDLAGLMRRFAEGAAEQDRVAEDARSATAQARFTGYLVVAMPAGAALFTELVRPGFLASMFQSLPALVLVGVSLILQLVGFMAISRLARIGQP